MPMGQPRELSHRDKAFLACYKKAFNASEAYRIAYEYKGKNADVLASQVLVRLGKIVNIQELKDQKAKYLEASKQDVIQEFTRVGLYDPADFLWQHGELDRNGQPTTPGELKSILDMSIDIRKCIKSIRRDADGRLVLDLVDKMAALNSLARYHKLLTDKLEVTGKLSLEQLVSGANEKDEGTKTSGPS